MAKNTKPMTKSEMIDVIATKTGVTKSEVAQIYATLLEVVAKETKKGAFTLHGLGKFSVVQRKARMGRNPATGAQMKIAAKKAVKFTVSKQVKDSVLGK